MTNDFRHLDTKLYKIGLMVGASTSKMGGIPRFHVGEKIKVKWRAPKSHSRKDWIGIYRVGLIQFNLNRVSSKEANNSTARTSQSWLRRLRRWVDGYLSMQKNGMVISR